MTYRKKLIEVALPLEAINRESAREKSIRHGHPSTLHLWWARRPLAACRAVLFAQLVDDPSAHPDKFPTEEDQKRERERLFKIIEELVKWENINNEHVLQAARAEILKSTEGNPPPVLDPFCGGGSIPLEAQRLGLKAYASDLNPVAVLITKALIEIPPKFAGMPPVHPGAQRSIHWEGAKGLAEDVRYYGKWMRDEAEKRIGHLYPKVEVTHELTKERPDLRKYAGRRLTVIAWLWARTVKSPNPAFSHFDVPLMSTFMLSTKAGKEAYVEPIVLNGSYRFTVKVGKPKDTKTAKNGTKLSRGSFRCLLSGTPIKYEYIDNEANAQRMGMRLMTIVAEGERGRLYLPPTEYMEKVARQAKPTWKPDAPSRGTWASNAQGRRYGFRTFGDYFTPRQLVALTTFSDLVMEARKHVLEDAVKAGMPDEGKGINAGGKTATAYADAVATYLGCSVSRGTDFWSSLTTWTPGGEFIGHTFTRQALPMVWDFSEGNPFSNASGNWQGAIEWITRVVTSLPSNIVGTTTQLDATKHVGSVPDSLISTDPPYYDNIGYADLSDFFYVWLRRSIGKIYPDLFSTMLVPKAEELVATPYRFDGDRKKASEFFETGLRKTFERMKSASIYESPMAIFYAFKQAETDSRIQDSNGNQVLTSTGWETMLQGLLQTGFQVTGTWPMRTERSVRTVSIGSNALASSVVLAYRPRQEDAPMTTRRDFLNALKKELPKALKTLQQGNIAPVDMAQSAIGPGMAIFSRYSKVVEADGSTMMVRSALALINLVLDEYLAEQEGEYDADTRWALAWFEQNGVDEGPFGIAETLSKAKNTAVDVLARYGFFEERNCRMNGTRLKINA